MIWYHSLLDTLAILVAKDAYVRLAISGTTAIISVGDQFVVMANEKVVNSVMMEILILMMGAIHSVK